MDQRAMDEALSHVNENLADRDDPLVRLIGYALDRINPDLGTGDIARRLVPIVDKYYQELGREE